MRLYIKAYTGWPADWISPYLRPLTFNGTPIFKTRYASFLASL